MCRFSRFVAGCVYIRSGRRRRGGSELCQSSDRGSLHVKSGGGEEEEIKIVTNGLVSSPLLSRWPPHSHAAPSHNDKR